MSIRRIAQGNYDTDFSNLNEGCSFPSDEVRQRNIVYRFNKKLFTGDYALNKNLVALVNNEEKEIPYKTLPLNYFKLTTNKMDSLLFGNDLTISTGDIERDRLINKLAERTGWFKSVRKAAKLCSIYGDSCLKTYRNGASAFSPLFAYKVVDISDKTKTNAYVLHELLYSRETYGGHGVRYTPTHIRLLISCNGFDYERVYEYTGDKKAGVLGKPVRYKYRDRWIPRKGRYYFTNISDASTVQWLSINTEDDGVYGTSSYEQIKDIVFAIENRLSTENWVVDNHGKPLLLVGMSAVKTDEETGDYHLSTIRGKYLVDKGDGDTKPEYLTWDGKLDNSKQIRDDLLSALYELSEMNRTFLSGEYSGQITEESLNNLIKSALDRASRELNDYWYSIRDSLYVLCRLNNIEVNKEDININFNIGRIDDPKTIAETATSLINSGLFSKKTILSKFYGYSDEDADAESERIKNEGGIRR